MKKLTLKLTATLITLLGLFLISANPLFAYSSKQFTPVDNSMILKPGWVSSCHNDFVVENLGDDPAQIKIQLGIEDFKTESIPKWEKRAYDLRHDLTMAKQLGKTVHMDDVAQIRNKSDMSEVRIHC